MNREGRDALLGSSAVANQEHHRPAVERERGQYLPADSEIQYYLNWRNVKSIELIALRGGVESRREAQREAGELAVIH